MTRPTPRTLLAATTATALALVTLAPTAAAGRIEAIKGKEYRLTRAHGPWMIMVATFHEPAAGVTEEGLTPAEAADELVFELRKAGLPAYVYTQDETYEETTAGDSLGGVAPARYRLSQGEFCVLAGNYKTKFHARQTPNTVADLFGPSERAQKSLEWVKTKFNPAFLTHGEEVGEGYVKLRSGGVVRRTPGQPTALAGAFLTINPLVDPAEIQTGLTPLVESLNGRRNNPLSLARCPGKFSLVVKTFRPSSTLTTADAADLDDGGVRQAGFLATLFASRPQSELEKLGVEAVALADALRKSKLTRHYGLPTFVWHEADYSLVTVGSFADRNDPKIAELAKALGAKPQTDPVSGRPVIAAELVPDTRGGDRRNAHGWILDPQPTVIEVPRLN